MAGGDGEQPDGALRGLIRAQEDDVARDVSAAAEDPAGRLAGLGALLGRDLGEEQLRRAVDDGAAPGLVLGRLHGAHPSRRASDALSLCLTFVRWVTPNRSKFARKRSGSGGDMQRWGIAAAVALWLGLAGSAQAARAADAARGRRPRARR